MKIKKKYKYASPGSNKVVYGACEQESEKNLIFEYSTLDFLKKIGNAKIIQSLPSNSKIVQKMVVFRL